MTWSKSDEMSFVSWSVKLESIDPASEMLCSVVSTTGAFSTCDTHPDNNTLIITNDASNLFI